MVEDDPALCSVIEQVLHEHGIDAVSLPDPRAALRALAGPASPPDVLLVDLHLPHMGGAAFVRTLRDGQVGERPPIPIILMSGDPDFSAADVAALGVAGCLPKPFDIDDLVALVHRVRLPATDTSAA